MEAKMKELAGDDAKAAAKSTSGASSSGAKKKSGGLLGSIASAVSGVVGGTPLGVVFDALKLPAVKAVAEKIGGPVLAAAASALGFPGAAPLLLKVGPTVVGALAGAAGSVPKAAGGSGAAGTTATGGTSKAATSAQPSEADRQGIMLELQRLQQKQKEMFELVSNVIRSNHEARMAAIGNIR
jgi:hypothetical protein